MLTTWGQSPWDGDMWERESSGETTMLCPGEMNRSSLWKSGNLEVTPLGSEQPTWASIPLSAGASGLMVGTPTETVSPLSAAGAQH